MAIFEIPISTYPNESQSIELDGQIYRLTFVWNSISEKWHMTIADDQGSDILNSVAIVLNTPLTTRYRNTFDNVPRGTFMALGKDPTRDNFGIGCKVYYIDEESLESSGNLII